MRIRYGQRKNNQFLGCVHLYDIYVQQCVLLVSAPLQADLTRDDNTPSVRSSVERFIFPVQLSTLIALVFRGFSCCATWTNKR